MRYFALALYDRMWVCLGWCEKATALFIPKLTLIDGCGYLGIVLGVRNGVTVAGVRIAVHMTGWESALMAMEHTQLTLRR